MTLREKAVEWADKNEPCKISHLHTLGSHEIIDMKAVAFMAGYKEALRWVESKFCDNLEVEESHQYAWAATSEAIEKELEEL